MTSWFLTLTGLLIRACAGLMACVCGLGLLAGEVQASCGDHLQTAREVRDDHRLSSESPAPVTRCQGPQCQQRPAIPAPQPRELPRVEPPREPLLAAVHRQGNTASAARVAGTRAVETLRALPGFAEPVERPPR